MGKIVIFFSLLIFGCAAACTAAKADMYRRLKK
jgi:hypothetical protein